MSKQDEKMASIIGKAMLQPELRRQILNDPAGSLAGVDLSTEYQDKLLEGLREVETSGIASERLPKKFGTNAWGVGGSVL
ncbi:hypothetical protein MNBD_GAMMA13-1329 [hydrothermal vent metagenome]|uniref:Uncharacterized protein n=1 Tax=hydrothermal vent metagenome TaxID=652676 RepID=A0A3B0YN14_9ZZZZ